MDYHSNGHRRRLVNNLYAQSGKVASRVAESGKLASTLPNVHGPQPQTEPPYSRAQPSVRVKPNSQILKEMSVPENGPGDVHSKTQGFLIRENTRLQTQVGKLEKELADVKLELAEIKLQKAAEENGEIRHQIAQMQVQMINMAKVTSATHVFVTRNLHSHDELTPAFPIMTLEDVEFMDEKIVSDSKFEAKVTHRFKKAQQKGTIEKLITDEVMNGYTLSRQHMNVKGNPRKLATDSALFNTLLGVIGEDSFKLWFQKVRSRLNSKMSRSNKRAIGTGNDEHSDQPFRITDEASHDHEEKSSETGENLDIQEDNTIDYPEEMDMINASESMIPPHEIVTRSCTKTNRTEKTITDIATEEHIDQVFIITDEARTHQEENISGTKEFIITKQEDTMEYPTEMEKHMTNTLKVAKPPQKIVTKNRQNRDHEELKPILAFPIMTLKEVELMDKKIISDPIFEAKVIRKIKKARQKGTAEKLITDEVIDRYTISLQHTKVNGKVRILATESPLFKTIQGVIGEGNLKLWFHKVRTRLNSKMARSKRRAIGTGNAEHSEQTINFNTDEANPEHEKKRARTGEVLHIQPENTTAYPVEMFFPEEDQKVAEQEDSIIFIKLEDLD